LSGDPLVKDHRGLRRRPLYSPILLVAASLVAAAVILGWLAASWGTTTVILTRHAARAEGEDPALTEVGKARARSLSAMLADAGVDAIFVSEYRRTRQTAEPVAAAAGLTPVVVPAGDLDQLEEMLKEHHSGEVVLVVGHSNTIPAVAARLGADIGPIGEDDYGGLWVVSYSRLRGTRVLALRY
jgi:phosphohistidine phosphatase SixA